MRHRLVLAAVAVVVLAACSSGDDSSTPEPTTPFVGETTTTLPPTPVVAKVVSPEMGSVQGSGGRGMVVVLTFTAVDPSALPAQFRVGGDLPSGTPAKPGRNPAFPGLVVGTTTTATSLGGPDANLANLFQIVSPSPQPDGSMRVTAVWTNPQATFGSDTDVTLGALTVAGPAPDVIPQPLTQMAINSNVASAVFRLSAAEAPAVAGAGAGGSSTTTTPKATSTTRRPTTSTTVRTTTTVATVTTTTTSPAVTTTVPPTTTTTRFLGIF